jgi:hypothetical protein
MNESEFNAEFRRSERKRQNLLARHAAGVFRVDPDEV